MTKSVMSVAALVCCCGTLAAVTDASGPVMLDGKPLSERDAALAFRPVPPTAAEIAERFTLPGYAEKKDGALVLASINWNVPFSGDAGAPNFYMYRGRGVPLALRGDVVAVAMPAGVQVADMVRLLIAAGVPAVKADDLGNGYALVTLAQAAKDNTEMRALIDRMTVVPGIAYAAPVFDGPVKARLFVFPTPDVLARMAERDQGAAERLALAVSGAPAGATAEAFSAAEGRVRVRTGLRNGYDVLVAANKAASDGRSMWAEPDMVTEGLSDITPNDPSFNTQWWLFNSTTSGVDLDVRAAWEVTFGRSNLRAMVFDTGAQENHPDINSAQGRDFTNGTATGTAGGGPVFACERHGTPCAGIIAGRTDNGVSMAGVAGGSFVLGARFATQNQVTCSNSFSANYSHLANGINWTRTNSIRVTSHSYSLGGTSAAVEDAFENAYNDGIIHFASTGNDSDTSINYPSSVAFVNAVGAMQSDGTRAGFSNTGTGIQFAAPGVNVQTLDRSGADGYTSGDTTSFSGTSAACPAAAGTALLILGIFPDLSPASLEFLMRTGARDLGASGYDTSFGWGLPRAYSTINLFAPANDKCSAAKVISTNAYTDNMNTARAFTNTYYEPRPSCVSSSSNSVFYSFSPPSYGTMSANTTGSSYDTVLSVFTGCGTKLFLFGQPNAIYLTPTMLACNDDSGGTLQSSITGLGLSPRSSIIIEASKFGTISSGGTLNLSFNFTPTSPPNDAWPNAIAIPAGGGSVTGATILATPDGGTGNCGSSDNTGDVWYSYVPSCTGTLGLRTQNHTYDTVLAVFSSGANNNPQTRLACNDDCNPPQRDSCVSLDVTAGTRYLIRVSGFNGATGVFDLVLTPPGAPSNDLCENATAVVDAGVYLFSNGCATASAGLGLTGCGAAADAGRDVWYTFTAPGDGDLTVNTFGSNFDTVLVAYDGCPIAGQAAIACSDDAQGVQSRITIPVVSGQQYLLRAGGYVGSGGGAGAAGDGVLNVDFVPALPPACSLADIVSIGGSPPPDGLLTGDDFNAFIGAFAQNDLLADIVSIGGTPPGDGLITGDDFNAFIAAFAAGCP